MPDDMMYDWIARPAAEALFWILLKKYQAAIVPILVKLLEQSLTLFPPTASATTEFENMLLKDAIYSSIGRASVEVSEALSSTEFSFTSWYQRILRPELINTDAPRNIIRRRVLYIVAEWRTRIADDLRSDIYLQVGTCLADKDLVVRLTALRTLYNLLDWGFEKTIGMFTAQLPIILPNMFGLIADCDEFDTKENIIQVLRVIVKEMGTHIKYGIHSFFPLNIIDCIRVIVTFAVSMIDQQCQSL
jgi:hypothetical protein